jgi:hypothetical protein
MFRTHYKTMKTNPTYKEELNLATLFADYSDEDKARGLLESLRWPHPSQHRAFHAGQHRPWFNRQHRFQPALQDSLSAGHKTSGREPSAKRVYPRKSGRLESPRQPL